MRRLICVAVLCVLGILPAAGHAQEGLTLAQQRFPAAASDQVDNNKILAIGAGIIVGAAIASSALTLRGVTLLGAVAGGMIAAWWYNDHMAAAPLEPRRP